jgi:hypothetical protein
MSQNKNSFPKEKSNRIVLFVDLRDSTEILINFNRDYKKPRDHQSRLVMRNSSVTFTKPPIKSFI